MRTQLQQTVIGNIKFGTLHNAMRYPIIRTNKYKNNSDDYTVSTFDRIDAEAMLEILTRLKNYIASIRVAESR
jgi:hypothetical protein